MASKELYSLWSDYYHYSEMRKGILSWYPFQEGGRILEWHPDRGALTGFLASRCEELVCAANSEEDKVILRSRYKDNKNIRYVMKSEITGKFDYIVAINPFRYYFMSEDVVSIYSRWSELLNENGTVLLAVNNVYSALSAMGVKNTVGRVDDILSLRNELGSVFKNTKFYYVYPDMIFPQDIYTDEAVPERDIHTQLSPYAANLDESREYMFKLYKNAFQIMDPKMVAGSFLIECTNGTDVYDVNRIKLTADRGKRGLITKIKADTVEKCSWSSDENEQLKQLTENLENLKTRGIPVVPFEIKEDSLIMPNIHLKTLKQVLDECAAKDSERFIDLLSRLFEYINKSSPHTSDAREWNQKYGCREWGTILEKGYIEMTPLNCFYNDDQFIFFDQEYVVRNCPIKYIMYRCLAHLFISDDSELQISLEDLKKKFDLEDLWTIFEQEEQEFLARICGDEKSRLFKEKFSITEQYQYWDCPRMSVQHMKYLFENIGNKGIVCWGTGNRFDWFMRGYGTICDVKFVVTDDTDAWGTTINGVQVKSPSDIDPLEHRVIITHMKEKEVLPELERLGITDYKIIYRYDWE